MVCAHNRNSKLAASCPVRIILEQTRDSGWLATCKSAMHNHTLVVDTPEVLASAGLRSIPEDLREMAAAMGQVGTAPAAIYHTLEKMCKLNKLEALFTYDVRPPSTLCGCPSHVLACDTRPPSHPRPRTRARAGCVQRVLPEHHGRHSV